jgi:hypothetical protein
MKKGEKQGKSGKESKKRPAGKNLFPQWDKKPDFSRFFQRIP